VSITWILDTNIVSKALRGGDGTRERLQASARRFSVEQAADRYLELLLPTTAPLGAPSSTSRSSST